MHKLWKRISYRCKKFLF